MRGSSWSHVDIVDYQKKQERWNSKKRLTGKDFSRIDARQLHVAECCSVLQRVAVCCSVLLTGEDFSGIDTRQLHVAVHCSVLQCVTYVKGLLQN